MKKYIGIASISMTLIFTACSQKSPEQDLTKDDNNTETAVTVSSTADAKLDTIAVTDNSVVDRDIIDNNINNNNINVNGLDESQSNNILDSNSLENIYFAFNKFDLSDNMVSMVGQNIDLMLNSNVNHVKIEGNCDEWGTDEYNYALGLKRAKTVRDELISKGISQESLILVSYGESNPTCNDKTKDCWQKNRRVEFKIID